MLKKFFWPKNLRTPNYKKYYFQQDEATPHTAITVQTWLSGKFGKQFINKDSCGFLSMGVILKLECTTHFQKH